VVVAGYLGFTALRLSGLEPGWPVVVLLAYTPYLAAGLLLPLALAVGLRAWWPLAAAAVCAALLAALVLPRAVATHPPPAGGPALRVMAVNLYGGGADPAAVVTLVRQHRVDVLAALELTGPGADALAAAGLDARLPHRLLRPGDSVEGSGIYAAHPLAAAAGTGIESRFAMPAATLAVPGAAPVELVAVHPVPPVPGQVPRWRRELRALPPATPDGTVRVLAGDFNATLDHAPLRELIATGYADAGDATGAGLVGTWRDDGWPGRLLPPVPLDRVLADSRVAVAGFSVHPVPGSDHHAVIAELALPPGPASQPPASRPARSSR
jgi:endonuclease/exonuclease/phosphatase (EEP) superfamily protein YafD